MKSKKIIHVEKFFHYFVSEMIFKVMSECIFLQVYDFNFFFIWIINVTLNRCSQRRAAHKKYAGVLQFLCLLMLNKYICIKRKNIRNGKSCRMFSVLSCFYLLNYLYFSCSEFIKQQKWETQYNKLVSNLLNNSKYMCILCFSVYLHSSIQIF